MSDPASSALEPPPVPPEDAAERAGGRTDRATDERRDEGPGTRAASRVGDGSLAGPPSSAETANGDSEGQEATGLSSGQGLVAERLHSSQDSPDFRMALVVSVSVDLPSQHPTVVLRELEPPRRQLSFSVALPDGVTLSHAVRRIPTPRPLTQELLSTVIQGFRIDVVAVRLVGRQGAVYFAEIDLRSKDTRAVYSCRPSDALTVALLQPVPVPILIDRRLLEESGDVAPAPPFPPG